MNNIIQFYIGAFIKNKPLFNLLGRGHLFDYECRDYYKKDDYRKRNNLFLIHKKISPQGIF
jgi:hypothetical protein